MYHQDDDEDPGDSQDPDQADAKEDEDSVDTDPCPYCGKPVYEQAEVCPHCGKYISREESLPPRKPIWIILGAIFTLIAFLVVWVILRQN
jgi:predicted nucleic acid-binding Zn ribbon protein